MERRSAPRAPVALPLEICDQDTKKKVGIGFITNLSEGGLALETTECMSDGDKRILKFSIGEKEKIMVIGEVRYKRGGILSKAYGFQFLGLTNEDKLRLKGFVEDHLE